MHDCNWHGWGGHMMWIYWVPLLLIGIWLLVRMTGQGKIFRNNGGDTPLEILRKRYANGEITTEEYEERKRILEGK